MPEMIISPIPMEQYIGIRNLPVKPIAKRKLQTKYTNRTLRSVSIHRNRRLTGSESSTIHDERDKVRSAMPARKAKPMAYFTMTISTLVMGSASMKSCVCPWYSLTTRRFPRTMAPSGMKKRRKKPSASNMLRLLTANLRFKTKTPNPIAIKMNRNIKETL
jgi:hypothetical protein